MFRQLSVLKEADPIRDTREGKYIYYELNTSVLAGMVIAPTVYSYRFYMKHKQDE